MGNLCKLHLVCQEDLLQEGITVDKLLLMELVGLDVLPQGGDDDRPSLGVHAQ